MKNKEGLRLERRKFLHYGTVGAITLMIWPFISACNSNATNSKDQQSDAEDKKTVP